MKLIDIYKNSITELEQSLIRRDNITRITTDKIYSVSINDISINSNLSYISMFNILIKFITVVKMKRGLYLLLFYDINFNLMLVDVNEFCSNFKLESDSRECLKLPYKNGTIYKFFTDLQITAKINYNQRKSYETI